MYVAVRINMMICGFMGVMFFTQLNKRVGHYLTVIEKMMKVSMSFLLIGLLLFLSFAMAFYLINSPDQCTLPDDSLSGNYSSPFDKNYDTYLKSIYNTFLLGLAVTAPDNWYFKDFRYPTMGVLYYVMCLTFSAIIMMNLLIAIMNEKVMEICKHKKSILAIQKLTIYLSVEDKQRALQEIRFLSHLAMKCLKIKSDVYNEGGRVYLHVVEPYKED
jgi:hypothetical protein